MEDFILYIIKSLVSKPDSVKIVVREHEKENSIVYKVKVDSEDLGKVIGKNGKIINNIRNLVKSISKENKRKVLLKVGVHEDKDENENLNEDVADIIEENIAE